MEGAKLTSLWLCAIVVFCCQLTPAVAEEDKEGDVRLNGPAEEKNGGRVEWFHGGVWLSLCGDYVTNVAPVICRQLGFPEDGALMFYGGSYGPAPGETYRGRVECGGHEQSLSSCTINDAELNCNPNMAIGLSCRNDTTQARNVRLGGQETDDPHEGRLELFINGVWGTVCRRESLAFVHQYNNAHVVCRQLFGSSFSGSPIPAHESVQRFGKVPQGAIFRSQVQCNGTEANILDCPYSQAEPECTHYDDAGIQCFPFPLPSDCGGYLTEDRDTIGYPGYPAGYPYAHDLDCVWKIVTTPDKYIRLTFPADTSSTQSASSFVSVVDGDGHTVLSRVDSPTNASVLPKVVQNIMYVRMHLATGAIGPSFNVSWTASCGTMYFSENGTILSPGSTYNSYSNYYNLGPYPPNVDCDYIIRLDPSYLVRLTFYEFYLDAAENKCLDYIKVIEEGSEAAPLLGGPHCGATAPRDLTASHNFVTVRFHSDNITTSSWGFRIFFQSKVRGCGGTFFARHNNLGNIHSPGYPDQPAYGSNCVYIIRSPNLDLGVTLNVTQLLLQYSLTHYDHLMIIDGEASDSQQLVDIYYSSPVLPYVVTSSGSVLYVSFTTDNEKGSATWNASYTAKCEKVFTAQSDNFQSPGYFTPYPSGMDCFYHVRPSAGNIVHMVFSTLQPAGRDTPCTDYFKIYDGDSVAGSLLGEFRCNSTIPPAVTSATNAVLLRFHIEGDPVSLPHLHITYTGCGSRKYTRNTDSISSPGYPGPYGTNLDCNDVIYYSTGYIARLSPTTFSLDDEGNCQDFVQIYDGGNTSYPTLGGPYCGKNRSTLLFSTGNKVTVRFHTDGHSNSTSRGYQIHYTWIDQNCNTTHNDPASYIQSPGLYGPYPPNLDCAYLIRQPPEIPGVRLEFDSYSNSFDPDNGSCLTEYVKVYDGDNESASVLGGPYCGSNLPQQLVSSTGAVLIRFRSDGHSSSTAQGFRISYYAVDPDPIVMNVSGVNGTLSSPGYPLEYENDTDYVWYITVAPHKVIALNFTDFRIPCYGPSDRRYDKLEIRDTSPNGTLLADICGTGLPQTVRTTTNVMYIRFRSSSYYGRLDSAVKIFSATWNSECPEQEIMVQTNSTGTFRSLEYPAQYPPNLDCGTLLRMADNDHPEWHVIHLNFTSFRLDDTGPDGQCHDYLEVFDGRTDVLTPRIGQRHCGSSLPLPMSVSSRSEGAMYVMFHSDNVTSVSSTGFSATYQAVVKKCESLTMTEKEGNFTSPAYPLPFPPNSYCAWSISVDSKYKILLDFLDFSVGAMDAANRECQGAHIRLYDSDKVDPDTVIDTLCGQKAPERITSVTNNLTIVLNSFGQSSIYSTGFRASYSTIDKESADVTKYALFEYGKQQNDEKIPPSYTRMKKVTISSFPFGKADHYDVFIGKNGMISVGSEYPWPNLSPNNSMVCAYCAYINHSHASGGIYYQVYKPGYDRGVLDKATREVLELTPSTDFKASVAVVVTWDRVKQGRYSTVDASPQSEEGEATFQLALVTDGGTSYVIVYYVTGAMKWQYRGEWSYVVIGVSGGQDGDYQLNMYSRKQEAYTIDNVSGNTGRKGIWVYKVGEKPLTPHVLCRKWLDKNLPLDAERRPKFETLPPCPCSDRDVWRRSRFMWAYTRIDHVNKLICYRLNRASSRQHYPLGKECCYSYNVSEPSTYEKLVVTPPFAGSSWAFNPVYPELVRQHYLEDRQGYEQCCQKSPKRKDCQKYYELRPVGQCQAEVPFQFSWMYGDPHIKTLDGREYTFNGWGEYVLVTIVTPDLDFTLQGRTAVAETEGNKNVSATVFTAFGMQENGTRVFVGLDPATKQSLEIYGKDVDYSRRFFEEGDQFIVDDDDFTLSSDNGTVIVSFPSGISVSVAAKAKSLSLSVSMPKKLMNKTRGLLGNFNGVKEDDFVLPNGTVLRDNMTDREIHNLFGQKWLVDNQASVMRYREREGPANFSRPDFVPLFLDESPGHNTAEAEGFCGAGNKACIYDFLSTGSEEFATVTANVSQHSTKANEEINNTLPVLRGIPRNISIPLGVPTTFQITAEDLDGDEGLTYRLVNDGKNTTTIDPKTGNITTHITKNEFTEINGNGVCDYTSVRHSTGNNTFPCAVCLCDVGWAGDDCNINRDACLLDNPCDPLQNCTDLTPQQENETGFGYTCSDCPIGYVRSDNNSNVCLDVDECQDKNLNDCQMNCTNTGGGYQCACKDGFRLAPDGRSCVDVNECAEMSHNCEQICNNIDGGFACDCYEGYQQGNRSNTCRKIPTADDPCTNFNCSHLCRADLDSAVPAPVCFCPTGYELSTNNITCIDVDECSGPDSVCPQRCNNTEGSFVCSCYPGYQLNPDQRTCSTCPALTYGEQCQQKCYCNGRADHCDPVTGCVCQPGWTGSHCKDDVDECHENPDVCGHGAICVNVEGSYSCGCQEGFAFDEHTVCTDVDECSQGLCGEHELCKNLPGSYSCTCRVGYLSANATCKDIDECAVNKGGCQHTCSNVDGSYNCECHYGYALSTNRATCVEMFDPCTNSSCDHDCILDENDRQICICRPGFKLQADNHTCQDVNECDPEKKLCSHVCNNTEGSFVCSCPVGMTLDNDHITCKECPPGLWGQNCESVCECGVGVLTCDRTTGCVCKDGWAGVRCTEDIDECQNDTVKAECQAKNAYCFNFRGGYRCRCRAGYFENGTVCEDVDECANSPCSQGCQNSPGSYKCLCNRGFAVDSGTGDCKDINECALSITNKCTQQCLNMEGSYRCGCDKPEYVLHNDGYTCTAKIKCNRTDCDSTNGGCSVTSNDGDVCFCNSGYHLEADNVTCTFTKDDWCGKTPPPCDQGCQNSEDGRSFTCSCYSGFRQNDDNRTCSVCEAGTFGAGCRETCRCNQERSLGTCDPVSGACTCEAGWTGDACNDDVNECDGKPCEVHSSCSNTQGSFHCICHTGYTHLAGMNCSACPDGLYGTDCKQSCSCSGDHVESCDHADGTCYCKDGWEGPNCDRPKKECQDGQTKAENGECIATKGFSLSLTVGVTFTSELTDPHSQAYRRVKRQAEEQLFEKLSATITSLIGVEIVSISEGSIVLEVILHVRSEDRDNIISRLPVVTRVLFTSRLTLNSETGAVALGLGGRNVDESMGPCEIVEAFGGCGQNKECAEQADEPICRTVDSRKELPVWLLIALAVGIPVLVVIVCIVTACYCMKCRKTKKGDDTRLNGEELNGPYHGLRSREMAEQRAEHPYQSILKHMKSNPEPLQLPRVNKQAQRDLRYGKRGYSECRGQKNAGFVQGDESFDLSEGYERLPL